MTKKEIIIIIIISSFFFLDIYLSVEHQYSMLGNFIDWFGDLFYNPNLGRMILP